MARKNNNQQLWFAGAALALVLILNVWMLIPGGSDPDSNERPPAPAPEGNQALTTENSTLPESGSANGRAVNMNSPADALPSSAGQPGLNEPEPEALAADGSEHASTRPLNRAMESIKAGDYDQAISILEDLVEANPEDITAISWLGMAHYEAGNDSMSVHYLEEARRIAPDDPGALKYLALVLYRQGKLDKVSKLLAEYTELRPDDSQMADFALKVGRELSAEEGFIRESTEHFEIYYDNRDIKEIGRAALRHLDDAYRRVGSELGLYPDRPVPVLLYSNKAFREATAGPEWMGGLFDGKIRLPVKGLDPDDPRLRSVLMHEYTHAVVFGLTRACPSWLNEGLARYFDGSPLTSLGQRIDLRMLEASFLQLDASQAALAYGLSHSAVSFLTDKYGLYRVRGILESMNRGKDFEAAFYESMPVSYSSFIEQWNDWSG